MAHSVTLGVACLFTVIYIAQHYIRQYLDDRRFARFAREHGCEKPSQANYKLPWGLDLIYGAVTFKGDYTNGYMARQYREFGNTFSNPGPFGLSILNTVEPKNIQTMLALKFNDFVTGEIRAKAFGPWLGKGILTTDGAAWEHSRALIRPQFTRDQISVLEGHDEHLQHLFRAMPVNATGWTDGVKLLELLHRFATDTSTSYLFGHSINLQQASLGEISSKEGIEFHEASQLAEQWSMFRVQAQNLYWLISPAKYWRACSTVQRFMDGIIVKALQDRDVDEKIRTESGTKQKYSVIGAMTAYTKDVEEIRNQTLALLIAGKDTTAATLGWTFMELARHPEIWNKLRRQILEEFGGEQDEEEITFEKLKGCRYLQHVLNETLRLHTVSWINARTAVRDTILPVGGGPKGDKPVAVREGTVVLYSDYVMHRRKDLWGEDAEVYRPERWVGRSSSWDYLPFNGGPRICIGQQFALTECSYVLVRMLQRFSKIELTDPSQMFGEIANARQQVLIPEGGVNVRFFRDPAPNA